MLDRLAGGPECAVLPVRLRGPLGVIAVVAAVVLGVVGVMYAGHRAPGRLDRWFMAPTADAITWPWRGLALVVDFLAEPLGAVLLVVLAVAGCLLLRDRWAAVFVAAAAGATVAVVMLVKPLVGRTIHGEGNLAYPSGHTAFLTALAVAGAMLTAGRCRLGRTAGVLLVLGAALAAGAVMGWAQVALSSHYATDALGGLCTALVVVPATGWCVDRAAGARRLAPAGCC